MGRHLGSENGKRNLFIAEIMHSLTQKTKPIKKIVLTVFLLVIAVKKNAKRRFRRNLIVMVQRRIRGREIKQGQIGGRRKMKKARRELIKLKRQGISEGKER